MPNNEAIDPKDERELKWKELAVRIEHYKYYLDMALKVNVFFYVVAGGVLGFYLKDPATSARHPMQYVLLLPILIGAVFGGVFIYGARLQEKAIDSIEHVRGELKERLGLSIEKIHDAHLLNILLRIFGYIFFFVAMGLAVVPLRFAPPSGDRVELPAGLAVDGNLISFLLLAVLILAGGRCLPLVARGIDKRLTTRRRDRGQKRVKNWRDIISKMDDDIQKLKHHPSYPAWRRYMSKKTIESIEDGTFKIEFLDMDMERLEKKWQAEGSDGEAGGWDD